LGRGLFFCNECNELRKVPDVVEDVREDNGDDGRRCVDDSASNTGSSGNSCLGTAAREEPRGDHTVAIDARLMGNIARANPERDG